MENSPTITRAGMLSLALCVIIFPFNIKLSVVLLCTHYLVTFRTGRVVQKPWLRLSLLPVASMLFYLHHLISVLYTSNVGAGMRDLETKTTFLVFPLLGLILPRSSGEKLFFRKAWIASTVIVTVYYLSRALFRFEETGITEVFFYDQYSHLMHPTYFTMMLNIAVIFHLLQWKESPGSVTIFNNYFLFGILILSAALCSSRGGLMVILVTLFLFFILDRNAWKYKKIVSISFVAILIIFPVMLIGSRYGIILKEAFRNQNSTSNERVDNTPIAHRYLLWQTALKVALDNPFGTGSGDVVDKLVEEYNKINFEKAAAVHYNPHNQYLQTAIGLGVSGLLLLLLMLISPIINFIKNRQNFQVCIISLIFFMNAFFESVFEVQKGVLLFGLMMVFVFIPYPTIKITK